MASTTPPMEIITDILLRLPIKDLLRSKSVARSWYSLISSRHFIKLHLPLQTPSSLLLTGPTSLQILHSPSLTPLHTLPFPQPLLPSSASLVGSLHGLVCVFSRKALLFALINPATRHSSVIPSPALDPRCSLCLGFGYNHINDDYWIIQISSRSGDQHEFKRRVRVFSLRSGEWRVVKEEVCDEEIGGHGGVANGRMHWVSVKPGREGKGRIVSFDVGEESFGEVMMPPYYGGQVHHPREVAEMEGKLCFLTEANRGGMFVYIDVWSMREYGNENSWNKLYSVWCLSLPYPVLSEGEGHESRVLYCEDGNLCWFHRYEQKKDRPEVRGVDTFSEAVVSVASLVPVSFRD